MSKGIKMFHPLNTKIHANGVELNAIVDEELKFEDPLEELTVRFLAAKDHDLIVGQTYNLCISNTDRFNVKGSLVLVRKTYELPLYVTYHFAKEEKE